MWAEVIVDIRTRELDRRFHYAVPQELAGRLQVGHRVGVPFGRRREVEGYVVGITGEPPSVEGVRPIHRLLDDDPVFSPHALAVARWMSESLLCPLAQALQPFLPPGGNLRRARAAGPLERKGYRLALDPAEAQLRLEELRRRAPRQAAALEILIEKPNDVQPARLLAHRANGYGALRALEAKGWIAADRLRQRRTVAHQELGSGVLPPAHPLTAAQEGAVAAARAGLRQEAPVALLLQGVTGSGKTEVYLRAIQEAVDLGGQAIALVPEISLTPQTIERFRARFGGKVAVLHSRLSDGERFDEWERAAAGEVDVVVGVRSAVFAPLPRLSLIVMDEEHETSYKQDEAPRYHAREVAWERIRRVKGLLLLGSATPSLETLRWAEQAAECRRVLLPERIGGRPLPDVEVVDLRAELLAGNGGMLSRRLQELIEGCLRANEQAILLLNRRGFASFLLCRACGHVPECPNCSVSLTLHEPARLKCHYCDYSRSGGVRCPECGSDYLRPFGAGTQKLVDEAAGRFPGARIARMDADTTRRKGDHERILRMFYRREADILVGTQMIAKGLDLPGVTLVGVVSADTALHFPDFRAAERTFQLLAQVAGRAGRGDRPGRVVLQTYTPGHYAIQAAARHDFDAFAAKELQFRSAAGYPPYVHLTRVLFRGLDEHKVRQTAESAARWLQAAWGRGAEGLGHNRIIGPTPAPITRLKGRYRWHILLKGERADLAAAASRLAAEWTCPDDVAMSVDPGPVSLL